MVFTVGHTFPLRSKGGKVVAHASLFPLSSFAIAIALSFPSGTREKTEKAEEEEEEATTVESSRSLASFPAAGTVPKGCKIRQPQKKEFAMFNARHSATLQEIRYFKNFFYMQAVNAILLLWDRGGKRKEEEEGKSVTFHAMQTSLPN